ncbi:MAG: hypothetical protein ACFB16_18085 [Phormidesmis sp.]
MILPPKLGRYLFTTAVVSLISVACSNELRDYTQLELKVVEPESVATEKEVAEEDSSAETASPEETSPEETNPETEAETSSESTTDDNTTGDAADSGETAANEDSEAANEDLLSQTKTALEKRLTSLSIDTAEVATQAPDQIIVRLPQEVEADAITTQLISPNQLTLRSQKPETDEDLSENIATLQRLLIEQNNFLLVDQQAEANALQPEIDETRAAILALFEPASVTGDQLIKAQAIQLSGFNIWEVHVWFDSEGSNKFAEQTKVLAGTGRSLGIFLDDVLLSSPVIGVDYAESGILGGEASISGDFTAEAARTLERQLNSGMLPVQLELVAITSSNEPEDSDSEDSDPEETKAEEDPGSEQPEDSSEDE